ncbi:MAG: ferritin-like domain-containing protein [Rubrobacter sp.]|nr:ferritin-like domain-containing protein [Rubrobacter sp.]
MAVPGVAKAHTTDNPPSDVGMLNFALTLVRLEDAFYRRVLNRFGEREFESANIFDGLGGYLRNRAYENFQRISEHEVTHVETLESILGKDAVPRARYNFGVMSVGDAVRVARLLENTGVTAYDGAIAHIQSAEYLRAGATIATVEARHAAYLNLLNRTSPFPATFDKAVAPRDIFDAAAGFISTPLDQEPYGPYQSLRVFRRLLPKTTLPSGA